MATREAPAAAPQAGNEIRSQADVLRAVERLPCETTEAEVKARAIAFITPWIEEAKQTGQTLFVLLGQSHCQQSSMLFDMTVLAEIARAFGSDAVYASERAPHAGLDVSNRQNRALDRKMPATLDSDAARDLDAALGKQTAVARDALSADRPLPAIPAADRLRYFSYRLGFFQEGFDPAHELGPDHGAIAERERLMLPTLLEKSGDLHRAVAVDLGHFHVPPMKRGLQGAGPVASAFNAGLLLHLPVSDDLLPRANELLTDAQVASYKPAPRLDEEPMAFLAFAKELGIDLSGQGTSGVHDFGRPHAEHVLKVANRLWEEKADAAELWQALGQQDELIRRHLHELHQAVQRTAPATQARRDLAQALRLAAAVLPMYGAEGAPEASVSGIGQLMQILFEDADGAGLHLETGLLAEGAARMHEGRGELDRAGPSRLRALEAFQRADPSPEQRTALCDSMAAGTALARRMDARGAAGTSAGDPLRHRMAKWLTVPIEGLVDLPMDAELASDMRAELQVSCQAAVASGDARIGCALLEAASLSASAQGDPTEARRLLTLAGRWRDALDFARLPVSTEKDRAIEQRLADILRAGTPPAESPDDEAWAEGQEVLLRWASAGRGP